MIFKIDHFRIKKCLIHSKIKILEFLKDLCKQKFKIYKSIFKLLFFILIFYTIKTIFESLNWVNIDWYIRMNYPRFYRHLSSNIFHIFSLAISLSLLLYTFIGFQFSYKMITLIFHVILIVGVKSLLQIWYNFLCFSYLFIGVIEICKFFINRKRKKIIKNFKYFLCLTIIFYYHSWNFYNNEPLTNFVNTPDFIPPMLCNNSNSNFEVAYKDFILIHNKMMNNQTPVNERKAVIFRAFDGGLGNRIQGLLSSFMLAILLKRAFFVDWYRNEKEAYSSINDLFQVY